MLMGVLLGILLSGGFRCRAPRPDCSGVDVRLKAISAMPASFTYKTCTPCIALFAGVPGASAWSPPGKR